MHRVLVILLCLFFAAPAAWSQVIAVGCADAAAVEGQADADLTGCCKSGGAADLTTPTDQAPDRPAPKDCEGPMACCCVKTLANAPRIDLSVLTSPDIPGAAGYAAGLMLPAHLNRLKRPPKTQTASA